MEVMAAAAVVEEAAEVGFGQEMIRHRRIRERSRLLLLRRVEQDGRRASGAAWQAVRQRDTWPATETETASQDGKLIEEAG